jgi:hypothetical protein
MRAFIALLVIVYLVGVGIVLSPTIEAKWNSATASELAASVAQALPDAIAWPLRAFHNLTERGAATERS